jgi:hypothetical protein
MMYLRVFLKVCEGCGSLWFRAQESVDVYCAGCAARMRALPPGRPGRRYGRRKRHSCVGQCAGTACASAADTGSTCGGGAA